MDKKTSNFSVSSRGYCFLCLSKISTRFHSTAIADGSAVYSLQDVARYLRVDMRKAFIDGGPIPSHLLAKVEKSRLTVELCGGCGSLADNVSKLCRQLEKLQLEIESGLESIHGKMMEANPTGRTEQFREMMGSELDSGMGGGMEIMEALRMETMHKCSRKISTTSPRLPIQKLTSEKIQRRTFRIHKREEETSSQQMSKSGLPQENITTEEPDTVNWTLEDDFQNENSMRDDLDYEVDDDSITAIVKEETGNWMETMERATNAKAMRKMETATEDSLSRKYVINPDTGKYKCQLCTMEYASSAGFHTHYKTVHRRVRFKCKICGKEFTQQGYYKRHHQSVHMGIRFQCKVCKKSFSEKGTLIKHQRKEGCASNIEQKVN